jgi:hypothetical protein
MDARNNLANQEVFRMARAADPKGTRTVGIITKCDALQQGDENMVSRRYSAIMISFLTCQGHGNRSKQGRAPLPWLVRSPKQIDSRYPGWRYYATEALEREKILHFFALECPTKSSRWRTSFEEILGKVVVRSYQRRVPGASPRASYFGNAMSRKSGCFGTISANHGSAASVSVSARG